MPQECRNQTLPQGARGRCEIIAHRLGIFLGVLKEIVAVVCDALDLSFRETVSSRHLFANAREAAALAERVEDFPGGMGERVNRDAVGILEEKANGYYKLPARRFKFCDLHSHGNSALPSMLLLR
jgi:hypothetical protein